MILMGSKFNKITTALEIIGKPNFLEIVRNIKYEDINQKQLLKLSKYTFRDDFKPAYFSKYPTGIRIMVEWILELEDLKLHSKQISFFEPSNLKQLNNPIKFRKSI